MKDTHLSEKDPAIFQIIENEKQRQMDGIELIPSENYVSKAVLEAMGSIMTNKYSEGYPRKRYYGGQEFVDDMEELAIERAKKLFGAEHINVQPYSGSPANTAVYFALLEYGDTVMGMKLDHGGHITHGLPISFSGKSYNFVSYGVDKDTELIDMEEVRRLALENKPKMIIAGFSAYPRNLDWKKFREIADEVGALLMADIAHIAGLIAGGVLENPVPYCDVVTTTTHKTLRGPRGAMIMCKEQYAKAIDRAIFPGLQGGPHDHTNSAKAVAFLEALSPDFKVYCENIIENSKALAERLKSHGFRLVSNGTDNHLILIDLRNKNIGGKEAEQALDKIGVTLNKNTIPFDPNPPFTPSGIRLGTPAVTTRGMGVKEMEMIGDFMNEAIENINDEAKLASIKNHVRIMCAKFPVPGI